MNPEEGRRMVYKQQHNVARRVGQAIRFLLALTITVIMIFPLFWMLSTSLKTEAEVMGSQLVFWPEKMQFENFTYVIEKVPFSGTCSIPRW